MLRAVVGGILVAQGSVYLSWRGHLATLGFVGAVVLIVGGGAVLIGFLTPIFSSLAGLECLGIALSWIPMPLVSLLESKLAVTQMITMCAAILFLGPGAFSLDARLFGWREIVIPPAERN